MGFRSRSRSDPGPRAAVQKRFIPKPHDVTIALSNPIMPAIQNSRSAVDVGASRKEERPLENAVDDEDGDCAIDDDWSDSSLDESEDSFDDEFEEKELCPISHTSLLSAMISRARYRKQVALQRAAERAAAERAAAAEQTAVEHTAAEPTPPIEKGKTVVKSATDNSIRKPFREKTKEELAIETRQAFMQREIDLELFGHVKHEKQATSFKFMRPGPWVEDNSVYFNNSSAL